MQHKCAARWGQARTAHYACPLHIQCRGLWTEDATVARCCTHVRAPLRDSQAPLVGSPCIFLQKYRPLSPPIFFWHIRYVDRDCRRAWPCALPFSPTHWAGGLCTSWDAFDSPRLLFIWQAAVTVSDLRAQIFGLCGTSVAIVCWRADGLLPRACCAMYET